MRSQRSLANQPIAEEVEVPPVPKAHGMHVFVPSLDRVSDLEIDQMVLPHLPLSPPSLLSPLLALSPQRRKLVRSPVGLAVTVVLISISRVSSQRM